MSRWSSRGEAVAIHLKTNLDCFASSLCGTSKLVLAMTRFPSSYFIRNDGIGGFLSLIIYISQMRLGTVYLIIFFLFFLEIKMTTKKPFLLLLLFAVSFLVMR